MMWSEGEKEVIICMITWQQLPNVADLTPLGTQDGQKTALPFHLNGSCCLHLKLLASHKAIKLILTKRHIQVHFKGQQSFISI